MDKYNEDEDMADANPSEERRDELPIRAPLTNQPMPDFGTIVTQAGNMEANGRTDQSVLHDFG